MNDRIEFEMKYIGWNLGGVRAERHETKGDIELLELKINGIDILPLIKESIESDMKRRGS